MQPDVLYHDNVNSFFSFSSCVIAVHGYPTGSLLLPFIDAAVSNTERGHGTLLHRGSRCQCGCVCEASTLVEENRQPIQQLLFGSAGRAVRNTLWTGTRPRLYTSEIIIALTKVKVSLEKTNSAVCALPHLVKEKKLHFSQSVQADLPGSVFLLPSAPMMTSNSSSLTGCVLGWTSALQPIPEKTPHV